MILGFRNFEICGGINSSSGSVGDMISRGEWLSAARRFSKLFGLVLDILFALLSSGLVLVVCSSSSDVSCLRFSVGC